MELVSGVLSSHDLFPFGMKRCAQVELPLDVMCVFIASEEATSDPPGAGVESLLEAGKLEQLKVWL